MYTWMTPGESRAPSQGSRCRIQIRVRNSHHGHCSSVPVRVFLARLIIALAFPALILSLACHTQCDTQTESKSLPSEHRVRVITRSWLCAIQHAWHVWPSAGSPTYFTTYKCAVIHYARSVACNQFQASSEALPLLYCATVQLTCLHGP